MQIDSRKIDKIIYSFLSLSSLIGAILLFNVLDGNKEGFQNSKDLTNAEGVISELRNDVRVKSTADISWINLFSDHGIYFGDQVFVGPGSEAMIRGKTFKAKLMENTLFTLAKIKEETAFIFEKGDVEIELNENNPIAIQVDRHLVRMKGHSRLLLNRSGDEKNPNLGLSVLEGSIKMITPSGRVVPTKEGQSFALLRDEKSKDLKFRSMNINLDDATKDAVFIDKQPVQFKWNAKAYRFKKVEFELADDDHFSKIIKSIPVHGDSVSFDSLQRGKYFWRIKGDTGTAKVFGPIRSFDVITTNQAKQQDPTIEFDRPGFWKVNLSAESMTYAEEYHFEVSTDEGFKKILAKTKSKNFKSQVVLRFTGTFYTRVQYKYRGLEKYSPWSEAAVVVTPTFQEAPTLTFSPPVKDANYGVSWSKVENSKFYRLFQFDEITGKISGFFDLDKNKAPLRALTRRSSVVWVRSHKSEKEFGFDSNKIHLLGFVDLPKIKKSIVYPKWLPRYKENQLPKLEVQIQAGLISDEEVLIEIADNIEMKSAIQIKTKENQILQEVPHWQKYFLQARILVDPEKYFTFPSALKVVEYPAIYKLSPVDLIFPKAGENILNASKQFFINFKWIPRDANVRYEIHIAQDKDFKKIISEEEVDNTSFVFKNTLKSGKYFWKVRSFNKTFESEWSDMREFSVINAIK